MSDSILGRAALPSLRAPRRDATLAALSILIQVPLALALGHAYDVPVFMSGGYLAATGGDPYLPQDLSVIFSSPVFGHLTSIGYPPPWLLVLAAAYRLSYGLVRSLFLYNLAIKVPVIAANVCLAYLTRRLARDAGADERGARAAFLFVLFNPLILYTTAAWGQFDTVVALFALLSLWLLWKGKLVWAGVLLGLAFSLKPTALPLLPLSILFLARHSPGRAARYGFSLLASLALFCAGPFLLFRWGLAPILAGWNAHFVVAGGLSWLTIWELFGKAYTLPAGLQFLGYLWLPALGFGLAFIKRRGDGLSDLLLWALRLMLLFFLTRAWLSEPNVDLVLPLALVLACTGRLRKSTLNALWIIPLVFTVFNVSLPQLLFLSFPGAMNLVSGLDQSLRNGRLIVRALAVIPWLIVCWRIVLLTGETRMRVVGFSLPSPRRGGNTGFPESQPMLSLVIPTYNERENVAQAIAQSAAALRGIPGGAEIIVVDDCSPDGTSEAARQAAARTPEVRVLCREGRRGLSSAILEGMAAARGEVLAVMDADLQHPPAALGPMCGRILAGEELVIMSRYAHGSSMAVRAVSRRAGSRAAILLAHLFLPRTRGVRDPVSGCFMLRRAVLDGASLSPLGFKVLPDILVRGKYSRVTELPYTFRERARGRSKMRPGEALLYLRLLLRLRKAEASWGEQS